MKHNDAWLSNAPPRNIKAFEPPTGIMVDRGPLSSLRSALRATSVVASLHGDEMTPSLLGFDLEYGVPFDAETIITRASAQVPCPPTSAQASIDDGIRWDRHESETTIHIVFLGPVSDVRIIVSLTADDGTFELQLAAAKIREWRPLLQAYFDIWQQRAAQDARCAALEAALDSIDIGIVMVDRGGNVGFVNEMATALLNEGTLLRRRGRTLAAAALADTMKLQAALADAIALNTGTELDSTSPRTDALLNLGSGARRLVVAAFPVKLAATTDSATAALLVINNPAAAIQSVAPACRLFGLSPVETGLACHLVAGKSLQEASAAMRLKEQTARSYLKQVFLKTEVNRQVDLVRLLLSTLVRSRLSVVV